MASPIEVDDDGMAPERTAMAWNRSGIAFVVAVAALGRRIWPIDRGHRGAVLLGLGVATMAFLASLVLASRLATNARYRGETMGRRVFRLVSIGTFTLATAGVALALFPA